MEAEDKKEKLSDLLKSIDEKLEHALIKEKKLKKFKMPYSGRVSTGRAKTNWVSICYIQNNGVVKFVRAHISEGVITIDGTPHVAMTEYVMNYKNKPFIIVPEWSATPFSPRTDRDDAEKEKRLSIGWKLMANYLEQQQIKPKGMGGSAWIWIVVILAICGLGYYAYQSGAFS
jgi:hypothetical protein